MPDRNLSILQSKINEISSKSNSAILRYNLYSLYTALLLNKSLFKHNDNIRPFLEKLNLNFKDYVYRSRTLLLSRVLRKIEVATDEQLILFFIESKKIIKNSVKINKNTKNVKRDEINFIDKYSRG